MSAADFLLSSEVQQLLKLTLAEPTRAFSAAELASATRLDRLDVDKTLPHLVGNGLFVAGVQPNDDAQARFSVNTDFIFYAELRSMALKSFAAAEPLRAMLRAKFRRSIRVAFLLGEDPASGTLKLLIVHGASVPDKALLDAALRKLVRSGAVRQHLHAQVISEQRYKALDPAEGLGAMLAAQSCVEVLAATDSKAQPIPEPTGLLAKARRRLARLAH